MHTINFSKLTTPQALALADGLAAAKEYAMAASVYRWLLDRAPASDRTKLAIRLGLAEAPKARTAALFSALHALEGAVSNVFVGEGLATWNKSLSFFEDARFMQLSDKHAHLLPLPNWHWNLTAVLWAVQQARSLPGDFVELGVFKGHTTLFCAEYVDFAEWPKTWRLYDTFEGVPDDQLDPGWAKMNKKIYGGTFSYEEVKARFAHIPNVEVTQGRVPEVLNDHGPAQIAFLHMDLNNSTAEIAALDLLFDRISPGGIIVFDDFGWSTARRQHLAEKAWFADRGLHILALPTGQGLFVKS